MYSLDINFLKDRPGFVPAQAAKPKGPGLQIADRQALIAGVAVGVFPVAVVGGLWFLAQSENTRLQEKLTGLESKANLLASQDQAVKDIINETAAINAETQGLVSLFNTTLKPVSALLQDVRDRVPAGVQVSTIDQSLKLDPELQKALVAPPPAAAPPAQPNDKKPAAPPPPAPVSVPWQIFTQTVVLSGTANSFDDVNEFALRLKQSKIFDSTDITLVEAQMVDNPLKVVPPETAKNQVQNAAPPRVQLPKLVQYKIEAGVSKAPASELVAELERQGAIGLATRIDTLKQKGVLP